MIIRQGLNGAVHLAGGIVMGVTLVLAACTVARTVKTMREDGAFDGLKGRVDDMADRVAGAASGAARGAREGTQGPGAGSEPDVSTPPPPGGPTPI